MTRYVGQGSTEQTASASVEIPEPAVAAAAEGLRSHSAYEEPQVLARSALEAALPYLAPAWDGGLREALEQSAREKIAEWYGAEWNPEDGGVTGDLDADAMLEWRGVRMALDLALAAHPAAHAVSVGTAESTASTSAVPQPASEATPELTSRPVDREALREQIAKALDRPAFTVDAYYKTTGAQRRREYALEKADAVLAVLAGGEGS